MKDFDALKNIWQAQVALPKVSDDDVLRQISKTKRGYANKLLLEVIAMAFAIAILGYIWMITPFRMWTTHLAMIILMLCCLYYLFVQINDYFRISRNKLFMNKPEDYIEYLKNYKQDRYLLNTRKYTVYTIFLGIAFLLYYIEIFFLASIWITTLGVTVTAAWFLVCYFFIMRNYMRKEEAKLQEIIDKLERLQKQFE